MTKSLATAALLAAITGGLVSFLLNRAQAQDVGTIDVVTMTALMSSVDGPNRTASPAEKAPDYLGVDLLAQWEGDRSPKISRFHDRQSGVEFICIRDRGCVLTGRKW